MLNNTLLSQEWLVSTCNRCKTANAIDNRNILMLILIMTVSLLFLIAGIYNLQTKDGTDYTVIINPHYASNINSEIPSDVFSPDNKSELGSEKKGDSWSCENRNDLLYYIREQMLSRVTNFSVIYHGTSYEKVLTTESFKDLMDDIFAYDDPSLFTDCDYLRLSWTKADMKSTAYKDYVVYSFSFSYLTSKEEEAKIADKVQQILAALAADKLTDSQKIRSVNNYIIENTSFDNTYTNKSAYKAIFEGSTICRGYSMLSYLLLNELSVPVRIMTGDGNGKPHAWNIVKLGSAWYNLDITWNDTTCSDSFYLKSDKDFYLHDPDGIFTSKSFQDEYPMASESYGHI